MRLVSRAEWGAPANTPAADLRTARGVKIHWIGGPNHDASHDLCDDHVRSIRQEHLSNPTQGWVDIAYNFVVCQHGYVYEGRGLRKESGANGNQPLNLAHYAVCAIQGTNESASDAMKEGLADAVEYLRRNGAGAELLGHRDGYATDCPGPELYLWVHSGGPRPSGPAAPMYEPPRFPGRLMRVTTPMMHGDDIRDLQSRLKFRGWQIAVDGWYGPDTRDVVTAYQREKGLAVDGKAGEQTWNSVFRNDNITR